MEIIKWKFEGVGPEFASISTRLQVDIARYRTVWGLKEDHPVVQTDPKYPSTPAYDESEITTINEIEEHAESTTTNDPVGDGDTSPVGESPVSESPKRTRSRKKTS